MSILGVNMYILSANMYILGTNIYHWGTKVYLLKRYSPSDSFFLWEMVHVNVRH